MSTNRRKQQARVRAANERPARQARWGRAAERFAQGWSQAEVGPRTGHLAPERQPLACPLGSRRHASVADAWADRPPSQGPDRALEPIEQALAEGALADGFPTDVWTLERIAVVIQD